MMTLKEIYAEIIMRGEIVYNDDHGELLYTFNTILYNDDDEE